MGETARMVIIIVGVLFSVLTGAGLLIWVERRLLALWQDRLGPNRLGPLGLGQVVADVIKIISKEDWVPPFADKPLFIMAPAVIMATTLLSFVVCSAVVLESVHRRPAAAAPSGPPRAGPGG